MMDVSEKELKTNYTKLSSKGAKGNVYLNSDKTEIVKIFKSLYNIERRRKTLDYLMMFPLISGSAYPKDIVMENGYFMGYTSKYYKNCCEFGSWGALKYSFDAKIKAIKDVDSQLKELHDRNIIFHDVNNCNLLIDKDGGHIIDFEDVVCPNIIGRYLSKYILKHQERKLGYSKQEDQFKLLISSLNLLYGVKFEKFFTGERDIDTMLFFVKENKELYEFIENYFISFDWNNEEAFPYLSEVIDKIDEEKIKHTVRKIKFRTKTASFRKKSRKFLD